MLTYMAVDIIIKKTKNILNIYRYKKEREGYEKKPSFYYGGSIHMYSDVKLVYEIYLF